MEWQPLPAGRRSAQLSALGSTRVTVSRRSKHEPRPILRRRSRARRPNPDPVSRCPRASLLRQSSPQRQVCRRKAERCDSFGLARVWGTSIRARFAKILRSLSATSSRSIRPDPTTMRPAPWLAERWEWRADGLELVFFLRGDVLWHDGVPLTAADAAFTFEVYRSDTDSAVSGLFALVESLDAVSERELRVRFTARDANWLFNVASLPIVSRQQYGEFWQGMPASGQTLSGFDWSHAVPVGTGPWRITAWDATEVRFTRFDRYWGPEPWLDRLDIAGIEGPRARLKAWQDGDSQILWPVRIRDVQRLGDATRTLYPVPAASVIFAAFNFANPNQPAGTLWADLNVRMAASRESIENDMPQKSSLDSSVGATPEPSPNRGRMMTS